MHNVFFEVLNKIIITKDAISVCLFCKVVQ